MSAGLEVRGLRQAFGGAPVLAGVDLTVPAGSFTALLGPSGCGKTTLLRVVAGFRRPDAGTVVLGGRVVAGPGVHLPPEARGVGVVPQEGALFPHLDVGANVGFGLSRSARHAGRVAELLELVGLPGTGARMPHELSGGQQQRVAVARALAPRPALVLLDEPFSALDAGLRGSVRADVAAAIAADGATALLVTHDQDEALSIADRVAVLRGGVVAQAGTPQELYRTPVDLELARFLGAAVALPGDTDGEAVQTELGRLPLDRPVPAGPVQVLVRPEQLQLTDGGDARVLAVRFHGADSVATVCTAAGTELAVRERSQDRAVGACVSVQVTGPVRAWPTR